MNKKSEITGNLFVHESDPYEPRTIVCIKDEDKVKLNSKASKYKVGTDFVEFICCNFDVNNDISKKRYRITVEELNDKLLEQQQTSDQREQQNENPSNRQ
jgi:hypothetical protein